MADQVKKDKNSKNNTIPDQNLVGALSYTPGNATQTVFVNGYHWTGYALWKFACRVYWTWDSTQITYAGPSTYGEIYDPSWTYLGVIVNEQHYNSTRTQFLKYVKGDFAYPSISPFQGHAYPWLDVHFDAGGTYGGTGDSGL